MVANMVHGLAVATVAYFAMIYFLKQKHETALRNSLILGAIFFAYLTFFPMVEKYEDQSEEVPAWQKYRTHRKTTGGGCPRESHVMMPDPERKYKDLLSEPYESWCMDNLINHADFD